MVVAQQAAAWCTATPPANPSSAPAVQIPNAAMACWPSAAGISGSGRGYLQKDFAPVAGATVQGGSAWGWWCQKSDLTWAPNTLACLDKYCPGTALKAVAAALASSSPGSALQAAINSYVVRVPDGQEANDYNCLHWNMLQALQATKPPDSTVQIWRTPNVTQRAYLISPSKTCGPTSAGTVGPNTLCDCTAFSSYVGTSRYCAVGNGCSYCVKASQ
ncbi:MAG: hypothetical protein JSS57_00530 [Proteobacteria bacterium]|nr:hypothetical protein [Pseudomonadota bacterium]